MLKKRIVIVFIGTLLLFLAGCASFEIEPSKSLGPETEHYIIPEVGKVSTTNIGEPLLIEGLAIKQEVVNLKSKHGNKGSVNYRPEGKYYLIGLKDGYKIFQTRLDEFYALLLDEFYPQLIQDESGAIYTITKSGNKLIPKSDYELAIENINPKANYEQRLVYTGSDGNILNFTYREFISNMARPAFTIEATYDLTKDNIIKFKNVSIEVIEFSNQDITYKILSGFEK